MLAIFLFCLSHSICATCIPLTHKIFVFNAKYPYFACKENKVFLNTLNTGVTI